LTQAGDVNAAMQQLAQTAESLTRQASWLNQLGLNQANEATQAFAMAYHQQLQYILLPALRIVLEQTLQSNLAQPAALYRPLKAYLMLGEPKHLQAAYLQDWFAHFLQQGLSDDAATATILQNALAALLAKPLPAQNLNQNLIAQVRQALNEVAPSQRAYNALQQQALARSQTPLNFDADTIAGLTQVFTGLPANTVIPGLYTIAGYQQVYLKLYEPLIQASSADSWIFGETRVKPSSTATLTQQLQGLYFADYIGYWSSTLNQLHLKRFADLRQAVAGVKLLASPTSPLQQLLSLTTHNTYLATTSNVPNNIAQDFNRAITPYFANIQQLLQTDAQQPLSQLQQQLQGLYGYLAALLAATNQQQACFLAAQTLIKQDAANPLVLLQQQLEQYPQPVQTWLKALVNQVAGFIFADAQAYLERQWQQQVYPVYSQSIQYHYPFGPRNQTEVTPADFATFFGPQGTLAKFNAAYLQAFIDTNAKTWQLRDFAGQTLVIKTENLSALQQAAHFTQLFFKADGKLGADFNLTPINMSAQTAKAQLQIDNLQLLYRHDPQLGNHLSWPTDNSRLNLQLIDLNAERNILNFTGAWALFQWLQTCKTQPQSATQYSVKCQLNGHYISYSLQADSVNNPFSQLANLGVWSLPRTLG
jgi:type VI secretion system protein ImpL